ncbi:hypothetical protein EOD42_05600 [Rhodovarius crocodyli]|uniref:Peptidoglycan-binding protein n=1 Tax=Rhodovarius crocodyli TaxID=1979269 RepID=A0A437MPJ0_9PROT|nr:peptidoglycan-binding protein [Rhodovarius crocodyli]RVT99557.1 hypothetical protein EOD42_05600 [Rhodovarius crocodyli]
MMMLDRALSFRLPMLRGADVRQAQQALRRAGLLALEPDGVFGPATRDAVLAFQRANGLLADGILGPRSWARLMEQAPPATSEPGWQAMLAPYLPALTALHGAPVGNAARRWRLTAQGVEVDGALPRGNAATVLRCWTTHGPAMSRVAAARQVPVELLLATACTESGGRADAVREEPGYLDDESTPMRVSPGLMQTLIGTAREALADPKIDRAALLKPETSIAAGAALMRRQAMGGRVPTGFDPPLVACAYNAGSLRAATNPWGLVQTNRGAGHWHADAFVEYFNEACALMDGNPDTPSVVALLKG